MKSRFLIIIVLLVAAAHVLVYLATRRAADERGDDKPVLREISRPVEPTVVEESDPAPAPAVKSPAPSEEAVTEAVNLIKREEPPTLPEKKEAPTETGTEAGPQSDATMIVGLVDGQSKLPPELFEVAEEGAKAVAAQDWEKARELYLEMVSKAPENALAYANLGVAEHQLGNLLAASGNLGKSLDLNPSIAQNWQTLGIIHYERDELELAISALTRAIHEDPSDPRSRLYLAAVIRSYGWIEASVTELERAVETDPEFADAHYNLAVTYLETTPPRLELARRHYFTALDLGAEPSAEMESIFKASE